MLPISLKKILVKILSTPMVLETGTDGIWTYRKWSNGVAECWARTAVTTYTFTTQSGYGYYTSANFAFPSGLFTSVVSGIADRAQGTGSTPSNTLITINTRELTTSNFSVWVQSASSGSQSLSISLYAIGTWGTIDPSTQTMTISSFSVDQMTKAEIQALIEASGNQFKDNDIWIPSDLT